MERTLAVILVTALAACTCASGDLMFIGKSEYELRDAGKPAQENGDPGGVDGEEDRSLPVMLDRVINPDDMPLQWLKVWMAEGKWRRDIFTHDPRTGGEPVLSVIRLEELGQTITLYWDERIAEIADDAAIARWEEQMGEKEAQAEQESLEIPEEMIQQLPPELQQQFRDRLAELAQQAGQKADDEEPTITVQIEGPLGNETILGLGCTRYKLTIETQYDSPAHGLLMHSREQTWVLLTKELNPPPADPNPWEWRGSLLLVGRDDLWEQATAGMDIPRGMAIKRHTIHEDLLTGAVGVLQGEMLHYDEADIALTVFDIPPGFTRQEMELPIIGEPENGQVQP